jgi:hypothetical protein
VIVLAYLSKAKHDHSQIAKATFENFSRRALDARFLQYEAGAGAGLKVNSKLGVEWAPMTIAFRNGVRVAEAVGHNEDKMRTVVESVVRVEDMPEMPGMYALNPIEELESVV